MYWFVEHVQGVTTLENENESSNPSVLVGSIFSCSTFKVFFVIYLEMSDKQ